MWEEHRCQVGVSCGRSIGAKWVCHVGGEYVSCGRTMWEDHRCPQLLLFSVKVTQLC